MRNRKETNRILYTNKKSGEFISTRRFNSRDYILTSIYDDDKYDWDHENVLNESWLDELAASDDWGNIVDDKFADVDPIIMLNTTDGGECKINMSDNEYENGFVMYVNSMLLVDSKSVSLFNDIRDVVKNNGVKNSHRIYFSDVRYINGKLMYILGGEDRIDGYIELQHADEEYDHINIIVYPITKMRFGFEKIYSSMSYEHFRIYNNENNLILKNPNDYYSKLVSSVVPLFNDKNINITLTKRIPEKTVNYKWFTTPLVSNAFVKGNLKPLCIYSKEKPADISKILNAVDYDMNLIAPIYNNGGYIDAEKLRHDEYYVIIAKSNRFYASFIKSIYVDGGIIDKENMIKMAWVVQNGIQSEKKYALAMPLSIFVLYCPIFYMMFMDDPVFSK